MRFLVRYKFVDDPQVVGVYRTAESVEEAFNAEKKMWEYWGKEIEFVEGFRVKQSYLWWLFSFTQVQCEAQPREHAPEAKVMSKNAPDKNVKPYANI